VRVTAPITERVRGLLTGTHTAGGRWVSSGDWREARPVSAEAPVAAWQDVPADRVWDLQWESVSTEDGGPPNSWQGPAILSARATLRVQYALPRTDLLEPPPAPDLGVVQDATRRAIADCGGLLWVFSHPPVWAGVALFCAVGEPVIVVSGWRVVVQIPLRWTVASAITDPGWVS
jgi:hypothetical protein